MNCQDIVLSANFEQNYILLLCRSRGKASLSISSKNRQLYPGAILVHSKSEQALSFLFNYKFINLQTSVDYNKLQWLHDLLFIANKVFNFGFVDQDHFDIFFNCLKIFNQKVKSAELQIFRSVTYSALFSLSGVVDFSYFSCELEEFLELCSLLIVGQELKIRKKNYQKLEENVSKIFQIVVKFKNKEFFYN